MANLFLLAQNSNDLYNTLLNSLDEETGEVDGAISAAFNNAVGTFEEKASSVACISRQIDYDIDDIDEEIARLTAIKKKLQKRNEAVKHYISEACKLAGIVKIKGVYNGVYTDIGFRKSARVEIDDEKALPKEYLNTVTTTTPDKNKIKADLKAGKEVAGARLVETDNLQIK